MATSEAKKATATAKAAKSAKSAPKYDREKAKVWGSRDFLLARFDDIVDVQELSRKCKDTKGAKAYVKGVSTPKDNLAASKVYRATFQVPGEGPRSGTIVYVSFGLNGKGVQKDYFDALSRLVGGGVFRVFDAFVDATDDVASVLCTYDPSREAKADA